MTGWKKVQPSKLPRSVIEEAKATTIREVLARKEFPCVSCGSTNCEGEVFPDNSGFRCWCLDCGEPFYGELLSLEFTDVRVKKTTQ